MYGMTNRYLLTAFLACSTSPFGFYLQMYLLPILLLLMVECIFLRFSGKKIKTQLLTRLFYISNLVLFYTEA